MSVTLREKPLKKGKISLYLDIYEDGKRRYEFLKLYLYKRADTPEKRNHNKETKFLAETIERNRKSELISRQHGFTPNYKLKTDFFQFCEKLINEKKAAKKSVSEYNAVVSHLAEFLGKDTMPIGSIHKSTLELFKDYLANKPELKQNSAFNYFARLKTILAEAKRGGIIERNPAEGIKNIKKQSTEKTFLTDTEIKQLASTPIKESHATLKKAFLFACYTGLRHVDTKSITWSNIQELNSNGQKKRFVSFKQQKTNNQIKIPLNSTVLSILESIPGDRNPESKIFNIGKHIGYANQVLKVWAKAAGINKDLTFHVARHSFATNLLIQRTDIYTVSKLLGHTSLKHTQIYAKMVNELLVDATDSLPDIEINF